MENTIPVPTKPEELDALPEYEGPDAIGGAGRSFETELIVSFGGKQFIALQ